VIYTPTGATDSPAATWGTSGTAGGTASRDWQVWDLRNIVDALQYGVYGSSASAPVEPWDGVNYICIGSVPAMRALKDDPDWEKAQYYGDPEKLFSGETGRIYGTRCVANNNDNLGNSGKIGTTAYKGEAVIFGNDPVMEIVATMEEIREAIPGDFGRDMALALVLPRRLRAHLVPTTLRPSPTTASWPSARCKEAGKWQSRATAISSGTRSGRWTSRAQTRSRRSSRGRSASWRSRSSSALSRRPRRRR
jgi:hypothetical protein